MHDPYAAPESNFQLVSDPTVEELSPRFWAWQGRVGRVQYFTYGTAAFWLASFCAGVLIGVLEAFSKGIVNKSEVLLWLFQLPILVAGFTFARRRLQDLDRSAWFVLFFLIPIVNLFFWLYLLFAPGTKGTNKYGLQPKAPSTGLIIAACLVPILIIGIILSVAIPAYHDYSRKAQENERKWQQRSQDASFLNSGRTF